jgi:putative N6-adenine-specific DNA methylase
MLLNPPYGERIDVGGVAKGAGRGLRASSEVREASGASSFEDDANLPRFGARELPETPDGGEFFGQLASHWKKNYPGWTAWMLTPDLKLPGKMRLKESRRVPMWNGPIECRLFRFDMVAGSARAQPASQPMKPQQPL